MTREIGFLLLLLLNTVNGVLIDDGNGNFVMDLRHSYGNYTIKYDLVSSRG